MPTINDAKERHWGRGGHIHEWGGKTQLPKGGGIELGGLAGRCLGTSWVVSMAGTGETNKLPTRPPAGKLAAANLASTRGQGNFT